MIIFYSIYMIRGIKAYRDLEDGFYSALHFVVPRMLYYTTELISTKTYKKKEGLTFLTGHSWNHYLILL